MLLRQQPSNTRRDVLVDESTARSPSRRTIRIRRVFLELDRAHRARRRERSGGKDFRLSPHAPSVAASPTRPAFIKYNALSGATRMHAMRKNNGTVDTSNNMRHECLGKIIHANAVRSSIGVQNTRWRQVHASIFTR